MAWIETIAITSATGRLRQLYTQVAGPDGEVDNIMMVHALRPHTMEGHMALYKRVLHHSANTVPKWFLEALGVYVSMLNGCDYCVEHHFHGLSRLLDDVDRATAIRVALKHVTTEGVFSAKEVAALEYARKLTVATAGLRQEDIAAVRDAGWNDGEILEINQVVAYFAYANRTVLGLGVDAAGDALGLSPGNSADPDDWQHG